MKQLKIISHLYPTKLIPHLGKFVFDQVELIEDEFEEIKVDVIVPTPYSIPFTFRSKKNNSPFTQNLVKPRRLKYISLPKYGFPKIVKWSIAKNCKNFIEFSGIDIAHIHFIYPGGLLIPTFKEKGIKTLLTIHGSDFYSVVSNPKLKSILDEIFESVDLVLPVGPQLHSDLSNRYPNFIHKFYEIHNFVDETLYTKPTLEEKKIAQQKLGWNPQKINFLSVTRNRHEKGADILAKVVENLSDMESKIQFHIVGDMNDPLRIVDIEAHSMINNIDAMPPDKLINYYHAANAYISTSRREGFGLAMVEAASSGLPVLGTPTGIAPRLITAKTGLISSDYKPESIEKIIRDFIKNYHRYNESEIREYAIGLFGKKVFLDQLTKLYRELSNK